VLEQVDEACASVTTPFHRSGTTMKSRATTDTPRIDRVRRVKLSVLRIKKRRWPPKCNDGTLRGGIHQQAWVVTS